MDDRMRCEKCGAIMERRIEGSTEGFFCTKCDWNLVTTYIPKIAQDITRYKVFLSAADIRNTDHVKAIAKAANINLLQARKKIQEKNPIIFEGEALAVDQIRNALSSAGVLYDIEPEFPY